MYRTEVVGAHGDVSLEAIDVRDAATAETTRLESGGLYLFIGADAETAWLPPEIALDRHGYVLTGSEVTAAGRWELERDPYLLETSIPGIFACGDVRFGPVTRRLRRGRGQHGDRLRTPVHEGGRHPFESWRAGPPRNRDRLIR